MKPEIELPSRTPVMTLPQIAFFPKVMMPLFIFEPRYRRMLQTSLEGNRMFAVAGIDPSRFGNSDDPEPPHEIATLGIIRGCRTQEDGTSQLILQGLSRIHLDALHEENPFREATITPLTSTQNVNRKVLREKKDRLLNLVKKTNPGSHVPRELLKFIEALDEPEDFVDLVAYSLVTDARLKQAVLNTLPVDERFEILIRAFSAEF